MSDHGVGMPHNLRLAAWGRQLADVFGTHNVYQVGSSIKSRDYHDVDVRVLLDADEYARWFGPGGEKNSHFNPRWFGVTLAFSLWGREATGLPIDFQVQRIDEANENHKGVRSCLSIGWIEA